MRTVGKALSLREGRNDHANYSIQVVNGLLECIDGSAKRDGVVVIGATNLPDKIDPAWSPNGQLMAFSWRRPSGNYDIYIMDVASRRITEITRDAGRNERPSWAPDGRHVVFESTRSGTRQIWTMLADGTQPHQLTLTGHNESPNWSSK